jgi:4-amino-4-deoxy-L-arabinose transferase-like glycosyltransferase
MNPFRWIKAGQGEVSEKKAIGISILALVGLCFIAFFNQLGTLGFMDKTEGLFTEIPRQMLITGDWITPRWNTKTFFDYPVWGYWMVGLSYRLFGVTTWAARLPTALAASATVFAVFGTVLRLSTQSEDTHKRVSRALLAATILALSPGWIGWGRTSVTDMFLSSSITLALLGFLLVLHSGESLSQRRIGHVSIALFTGIAVLAKGPVGVLLPGLTIIVFLLLKRQLIPQIRSTPWLVMIALFCGVALPWYAMASEANGLEFISKFIGFSNFERFTSVIYSHPGPPWFYLPWLFILLLPWSIYLPVALLKLQFWKRKAWQSNADSDDSSLFALVWIVVIIGFFSAAATKLAGYILPVIPAGSLLIAFLFVPFGNSSPLPKGIRMGTWINCGLFGLAAIATSSAQLIIKSSADYPNLAKSILASESLVILIASTSVSSVLLAWIALNPSKLGWSWAPNAATIFALLATAVPILAPIIDNERLLPIRELALLAGKNAKINDSIVVVGFKRYSVLLYSNKPAIFANHPHEVVSEVLSKNQNGEVYLLGTERELTKFGINPSKCSAIGCSIIGRKDAHFLIRSSIKNIQSIPS